MNTELQTTEDLVSLRKTALAALQMGSTLMATAALETAIEIQAPPVSGKTTDQQALELIEAGETEEAQALLSAATAESPTSTLQ